MYKRQALDVSKGTVKSIYALGAKLGMVERGGGHADALHALVQGLTGKESITASVSYTHLIPFSRTLLDEEDE